MGPEAYAPGNYGLLWGEGDGSQGFNGAGSLCSRK